MITTTRVVSRKASDTAAGYSGWVAEEDTRVVPARLRPEPTTVPVPFRGAPRQQQLYDLQPGDPDQLGPFRCIHRLKPGMEPVNADKPTPLLGTPVDPVPDGATPTFVVIKVLTGTPTADGQIRLREEQTWSAQQGVLRGHAQDSDFSWVARDFNRGVHWTQLTGQPEGPRERPPSAPGMILVGIPRVHNRREIHCEAA